MITSDSKFWTDNHQALLVETREKWLDICLASGPTNLTRAESAIEKLYKCAALRPPADVVWFDSPLAAVLAIVSIRSIEWKASQNLKEDSLPVLFRRFYEEIQSRLIETSSKQLDDPVTAKQTVDELSERFDFGSKQDTSPNMLLYTIQDFVQKQLTDDLVKETFRVVKSKVGVRMRQRAVSRLHRDILASAVQEISRQVDSSVIKHVKSELSDATTSIEENIFAVISRHILRSITGRLGQAYGNNVRFLVSHFDRWTPLPAQLEAAHIGQFDMQLAFFDFFRTACGVEIPQVDGLLDVSKELGWLWPFGELAIASQKPTRLAVNAERQLHSRDESAIVYPDGWEIGVWRGTVVDKRLYSQDHLVSEIDSETNIESRRVMIERYGLGRYLKDSGAQEVHRDECGVLYRKTIAGDEPLVVVKVMNPTAEIDGSHREYFLRVPPHMRTAREAVAWTFGMDPDEYRPRIES